MVGGEHHVPVVLYDHQRVAQVAQAVQRADEPTVVARVQADAGFVEDVGHPDEPESELGGEAHALGLAAGKRPAFAVEREVIEAGVVQEGEALLEPAAGFFGRHHARMRGEPSGELQRRRDRQREEVRHRQASEREREGVRGEAPSLAARADRAGLELQQALAQGFPGGRAVGVLEFVEHALPDGLDRLAALGRREQELALRVAVQQEVADGLGQFAPRGPEVERYLLREGAGDGVPPDERLARGALPGLHRAVLQRQRIIGDRQAFLEAQLTPQPSAVGAGPVGMVVRERARSDRLIGLPAMFAGQVK